MKPFPRALAKGALYGLGVVSIILMLTACGTTDVRQEHLLACEGYTAALEQIALRKEAGLYNTDEIAAIQDIEAQLTPLCQTPTPTAEGLALLNSGLDRLQVFLLTQAGS